MRLIDADALKEKITYRQWDVDDDLPRDEASTRISECYVIDRMVDDMPTVDAVPVVRCRECKYAVKIYRMNLPWLTQWEYSCRYYNTHSVMGDDWCSRAERKEE